MAAQILADRPMGIADCLLIGIRPPYRLELWTERYRDRRKQSTLREVRELRCINQRSGFLVPTRVVAQARRFFCWSGYGRDALGCRM